MQQEQITLLHQPAVLSAIMRDKLGGEYANSFATLSNADQLKNFCPNGAQERYINTFASSLDHSPTPVVLATFANGVGKTTATVHMIANLIYGTQNRWFDSPIFKDFPYPKKIWYCSTAEALKDTIVPMVEEVLAKDLILREDGDYNSTKDGRPFVSKMVFKNGWTIYFKTFDQPDKTYESSTVGLIVMDEPAPESKWKAIKSRRRKGCVIMLPMTPLYCPPYIIDEVKRMSDDGVNGYFHLTASVYEACMQRGTRGHLMPNIIDSMVDSYDADEVRSRAYGEFMFFSNSIYTSLDRNRHFVSPDEFPIPMHSKIVFVVDPHDSRPCAGVWAAIAPNRRIIIFDEYPFNKKTPFWEMKSGYDTLDEVQMWADREKDHLSSFLYPRQTPIERVLDKHFGWQKRGGKTFANTAKEAGEKVGRRFVFRASYNSPSGIPELDYGHRVVRKTLKDLSDGSPGLVIWNNCYHTWQGLTHYIRKHETGATADEKAPSDWKIVEKFKDFPDVVRYLAAAHVSPDERVGPKTHAQKIRQKALYGRKHTNLQYGA